jgi:glucose-6-phosphate dehydrogenase assembly protein OpcA
LSSTREEEWTGRDVTIAQIEWQLGELRDDSMDLRTNVLTHLAYAPPEWQKASRQTLAGLAERHPSRTILLFPQPDDRDALDADVSMQCFAMPGLESHICSEVIELRLCGGLRDAPASAVLPLLLPDLPVFLRWRGRPDFGGRAFENLIDVVDRLVVDSREWSDGPGGSGQLAHCFDRAAVSDIAWTCTLRWRRELAKLWPALAGVQRLHVRGPWAEAALLTGWLRSRLLRDVELRHEAAETIELVAADGQEVVAREERMSASDLLSHELDRFSRDPVYEAAVAAVVPAEPATP